MPSVSDGQPRAMTIAFLGGQGIYLSDSHDQQFKGGILHLALGFYLAMYLP